MHFLTGLFGFQGWEFSLAMRYLRTRRKDGGIAVIAIISFTGIMLAVMALISVMSIMNGFRAEMLSRLLAFGGHAYIYGQAVNDFAHRDAMLERLRQVPGVTQASPFLLAAALIQSPTGTSDGTMVRGVEPETLKNTPIIRDNVSDGSLVGFGEGEYGGNVIMIGDGLADRLGLRAGDTVTLISPGGATAFGTTPRRVPYEVGGIFHSGVSEIDRAFVYMPLEQAQLFFGMDGEWTSIEIKVEDNKAHNIAAWRKPLTQAAGEDALYQDWTEQNASLWSALNVERTAMAFILFFIVIIATLNIISGVVMLVKNKTRDIAILRTMGASRASISRVFFLTGTTIGAVGTFCGLILGVLFCTFIQQIQKFLEWVFNTKLFPADVYFLDHVPARMDPIEVTVIVVASLLAACVSTLFPSLWAAKLEPVEALRYE